MFEFSFETSESKNLYPFVAPTSSTGMRQSEVIHFTWEQVDLSADILILTHTKDKTS